MGAVAQIIGSAESMGATPPAAKNSILPPTDCLPACRSAPLIGQSPPCRALTEGSAGGCAACGRDVEPLHRLKQDEAVRNLCSACILLLYKGMYCCLCFVVYENSVELSDPSLWLTCVKCQRMSHLACAHGQDLPTDSLFFACRYCSELEITPVKDISTSTGCLTENGSPPRKKLRSSSHQQISLEEAMAAAHIVAFLAVRQARDAKARARTLAGIAARAAARAKAALDNAYRVAMEEARWKAESTKQFPVVSPGKNRGLPSLSVINTPRMSRADGRILMPNLPHLHSHALSHKHLTLLGYTSSNARFNASYNRMKVSPSGGEAMKSFPSSQHAFPRSAPIQKPYGVKHSPLIDLEGAIVSASPASILDAGSSLDIPCLNLSMESGLAHVHLRESTDKIRSNSFKDSSQ